MTEVASPIRFPKPDLQFWLISGFGKFLNFMVASVCVSLK